MMNLSKIVLFRIMIVMPFMWLGGTITAAGITAYHGYAVYFLYVALLIFLISIPCSLLNYRVFYLFGALALLDGAAFNMFGLMLLFFPQWNGWNDWNTDGGWVQVYLNVPYDVSYLLIGVALSLLIFFAIKKYFEIDYSAMEKMAFKNLVIDKVCQKIFLDNTLGIIAQTDFKVKYFAKAEYWLYTIGIGIMCIVFLPLKGLGSSMNGFGNNFFIGIAFFVGSYLFAWLLFFSAIGTFAQYRLIKRVEKELDCKLVPSLKKALCSRSGCSQK